MRMLVTMSRKEIFTFFNPMANMFTPSAFEFCIMTGTYGIAKIGQNEKGID
jgi:pyridoxal/pyridoxine/pyridoxamine kinase